MESELLPEEERLLVKLVTAWESVPAGQHEDFVFPPWGDSSWSLSHPGFPTAQEVPKVYLNGLAAAGLITISPPGPRTRRGSAPGGSIGIAAKGRNYVRDLKRGGAKPEVSGVVEQAIAEPDTTTESIDFVAWCGKVLRTVLAIQESSPNASAMGVRIDQLAGAVFGETENVDTLLHSSTHGQALVDADRELKALGLIEKVVGNHLRVPRQKRAAARDPTDLWRSIRANSLDQDETRILEALNRRSERRASDHAYLEPVSYGDLYSEVGLTEGSEALHRIDRLLGGLEAVGLARRSRAIGNHSALATYSGLVWEHRRRTIDGNQSEPVNQRMEVDQIWRGRDFATEAGLCFVLMPFRPPFDEIYEDHIGPAASRLALQCKRADDIYGVRPIMEDVWEQICRAQIVVADLTGRNPNVFYEVGIAHTIGKPVVLLTQDMNDVPFDLRHIRCIQYEHNPRGAARLEQVLEATLKNLLHSVS